ncbi:MAG: hypothetical protein AAF211_08065 [Myxococcota bacterium]
MSLWVGMVAAAVAGTPTEVRVGVGGSSGINLVERAYGGVMFGLEGSVAIRRGAFGLAPRVYAEAGTVVFTYAVAAGAELEARAFARPRGARSAVIGLGGGIGAWYGAEILGPNRAGTGPVLTVFVGVLDLTRDRPRTFGQGVRIRLGVDRPFGPAGARGLVPHFASVAYTGLFHFRTSRPK